MAEKKPDNLDKLRTLFDTLISEASESGKIGTDTINDAIYQKIMSGEHATNDIDADLQNLVKILENENDVIVHVGGDENDDEMMTGISSNDDDDENNNLEQDEKAPVEDEDAIQLSKSLAGESTAKRQSGNFLKLKVDKKRITYEEEIEISKNLEEKHKNIMELLSEDVNVLNLLIEDIQEGLVKDEKGKNKLDKIIANIQSDDMSFEKEMKQIEKTKATGEDGFKQIRKKLSEKLLYDTKKMLPKLISNVKSLTSEKDVDKKKIQNKITKQLSKIRVTDVFLQKAITLVSTESNSLREIERRIFNVCEKKMGMKRSVFLKEFPGNETNKNWIEKLPDDVFSNKKQEYIDDVKKFQSEYTNIIKNSRFKNSKEIFNWKTNLISLEKEFYKSREKLIFANLGLVGYVAKKHSGQSVSYDDLMQEGNVGLIKSVDKFNYRFGTKFSTFATWWIFAVVRKYINEKSRVVRVSTHILNNATKITSAQNKLIESLGREPTNKEIADELGMKEDMVARAKNSNQRNDKSFHEMEESGDNSAHMQVYKNNDGADMMIDVNPKLAIDTFVSQVLNPLESRIMALRYGFADSDSYTLDELGAHFALSRERIRQLDNKAHRKLSHPSIKSRLEYYMSRNMVPIAKQEDALDFTYENLY